jgi:hypothetical protein
MLQQCLVPLHTVTQFYCACRINLSDVKKLYCQHKCIQTSSYDIYIFINIQHGSESTNEDNKTKYYSKTASTEKMGWKMSGYNSRSQLLFKVINSQ